jgi:hypothetical protein
VAGASQDFAALLRGISASELEALKALPWQAEKIAVKQSLQKLNLGSASLHSLALCLFSKLESIAANLSVTSGSRANTSQVFSR